LTRALIASFGFDEKFVVRAILRHGIGANDEIVLVTGRPEPRAEKAYETVKRLADSADARVYLKQLGDAIYDFKSLIRETKKILREAIEKHERVTLLLSGGMRVIVLGLYTALLLLPKSLRERVRVELDTEDVYRLVEIPRSIINIFEVPELGAKKELLAVIAREPGLTIEELARRLNKDESTVRRQLQALLALGLVRVEGRPQRAYPTPAAEALL